MFSLRIVFYKHLLFSCNDVLLREAEHHCMKTRGVYKKQSLMKTSQFKGQFLNDDKLRNRFLDFIKD